MKLPEYIVRMSHIGKIRVAVCNNKQSIPLDVLCKIIGISKHSLALRIQRLTRLGHLSSPVMFHKGPLTTDILEAYGICDDGSNKTLWDRKKCRRGDFTCKHYADCQNKRLGLHAEPWIAPASTEKCFQSKG
jgi:hypothetical protein